MYIHSTRYDRERKQNAPEQAANAAHDYLMSNLKRVKHWSRPIQWVKLPIELSYRILPPLDITKP